MIWRRRTIEKADALIKQINGENAFYWRAN